MFTQKTLKSMSAVYYKKQKLLHIKKLNKLGVNFIALIGGDNIKRKNNNSITIDVSKVKDVDTALNMIEIVDTVR